MAASSVKGDVDCLFTCFKCGVNPPQSAFRERTRRKSGSEYGAGSCGGGMSESPSAELLRTSNSADIKFKSSKKLSPSVFYGSPSGAPVKKPSHFLRLLREIRLDSKRHEELVSRDAVWATFPRQEEAMRFLKAHRVGYVFSYQDHLTGQRRFLVSTHNEFWRRYKSMESKLRHHYEVIQEGLPCHLYFDLEFDKRINTDRNVDEMVDKLVNVVFAAFSDKYSICASKEWVIELDSSTADKFSRHLIIRIPKMAFKDNSHVGAFVSEVCARIANQRASDANLDDLYIRKDGNSADLGDHLFLDAAVYSRNRCFRLVYSSKAGKSSFLMPTERSRLKHMSEKDIFMSSLICRLDDDCDKLLVCKVDLDCMRKLFFDTEVQEICHEIPTISCGSGSDSQSTYLYGKSPFPALDSFIQSIASTGNTPGKIRCWYLFSSYGLMVYSMSRNRYCERIGREHKSNHVMYVIDLRRASYYQKCYDPDCKGYRSPLRPLPWDAIADIGSVHLTQNEDNYSQDINFDIHLSDVNTIGSLNKETTADSSFQDDGGWWQEAMQYADSVERMENGSNSESDDEWWIDVVKLVDETECQ